MLSKCGAECKFAGLRLMYLSDIGYTKGILRSVAIHGMWIRLKTHTQVTLQPRSPAKLSRRVSYQTLLTIQFCECGHFAQLMFDFIP